MLSLFKKAPTQAQQRAFAVFYAAHAPRLWGLILAANLPTPQAETILSNTLIKAWQHPDCQSSPTTSQSCNWLLRLACKEGLPHSALRAIFNR
ncbi:hypothetical protein [Fibrella aquatilis]|uniref:Uncharacterized protein n=1 Tax=Fibrella aquatilis TaxID=2817059 RepID=A0A939G7P4_9BACT|nr:hypothetical protein [Fibrella aquatilis]MBO0931682.1 hypothetical protein [Fibrella aquatilis]